MKDKEGKVYFAKGCLIFIAVLFVIIVLNTVFGFIFKGESFTKSFLDSDSEGANIGLLRTSFVILIIVGIIYFLAISSKDK